MAPVSDSPERIPCPYCAELVLPDARKCRYCSEWFESPAAGGAPYDAKSLGQVRGGLPGAPGDRDADDPDAAPEEITQAMLRIDPVALEVGPDLAQLANPELGGELLVRLRDARRRIAMEFGVIAPGVRVRPHPALTDGRYQIRIRGNLVAEGTAFVDRVLGIGADLDVLGIDVEHTTDPIHGTPAVWIPEQYANLGAQQGLQVFDAQDVVTTHVMEIVKQHLAELLTREEVAELLNMARQDSPMVVQELVPNMLALGQLRQVLQNLVKEQVSVKDLSTILNTLADNAMYTKDPHTLTEHVRAAIGRSICARYLSPDGILRAFMLSPDAERAIQGAIQLNESGQVLMLDPQTSQAIQNNLGQALADNRGAILDPVIITPPKIRRHVKALLERNFSKIVVLSYSEIVAGVQIEPLATIDAGRGPAHGPKAPMDVSDDAQRWELVTACPAGAETIRSAAIKCRSCHEWIEPPADAASDMRARWAAAVSELRTTSWRATRGDVVIIN